MSLASVAVLGLLAGCAQNPSWDNPSSWFSHGNVAQNGATATPGYGKGTLAAPSASPVPPVERLSVAPIAAPAVAARTAAPVSGKAKVAILLPLTGHNAGLGQAMLNAAQLAVFDAAGDNFELMPRDTGNDDAGAANAARDAIASGAQLLIGPLFGSNVPAVQAVAQPYGVSLLTLSSDSSLAAPGVFVMGFTPATQVTRVVTYAAAQGLKHFAALIPNNAYGALVGQAFQDAVARVGGVVSAYETYDPQRRDSNAHIQAMALKRNQIDVLFLPEGGADLAQITIQCAMAGFDNHLVRYIGTGLWDEPGLGQKNPNVVGGWYAASDAAPRQKFLASYANAYGGEPPRLVTLAYDATALAAALAKHGSGFTTAAMTNPNGFAGLDGIFRLTPQGLTERGLAINEVTADGAHVIDAAPSSFENSRW